MYKARVVSIGEKAISEKEPIIILFGEHAVTDNLKKVSVVQKNENFDYKDVSFGKEIKIDNDTYMITFKGSLVESNFSTLGHITLFFTKVPEDPQNNAIYLSPEKMPKIHVGTIIEY